MSIVKKAPGIMTREVKLEEPVNDLLEDYARFIESNADHVINAVLKKVLWRDQDYRKWREARRRPATGTDKAQSTEARGESLMQRATRIARFHRGYSRHGHRGVPVLHASIPRPADLPACHCPRAPQAFLSFKYLYYALLFTTPYLVCSTALSGLYIFTLNRAAPSRRDAFPNIPIPVRETICFSS